MFVLFNNRFGNKLLIWQYSLFEFRNTYKFWILLNVIFIFFFFITFDICLVDFWSHIFLFFFLATYIDFLVDIAISCKYINYFFIYLNKFLIFRSNIVHFSENMDYTWWNIFNFFLIVFFIIFRYNNNWFPPRHIFKLFLVKKHVFHI